MASIESGLWMRRPLQGFPTATMPRKQWWILFGDDPAGAYLWLERVLLEREFGEVFGVQY